MNAPLDQNDPLFPFQGVVPGTLGPPARPAVPGPVSLPQPQAKPLISKKTISKAQQAAERNRPVNVQSLGSYLPQGNTGRGGLGGGGQMQRRAEDYTGDLYSFSRGGIVSFDDGGDVETEEEKRQREAGAVPVPAPTPTPTPTAPPVYGPPAPSPMGAFFGHQFLPTNQPPPVGDLKEVAVPPEIKAAAQNWTPAQVVNLVQKAQDAGIFDNVKAALPALANEYAAQQQAKANEAGPVPGVQPGPTNLEKVQGILGPGLNPVAPAVNAGAGLVNKIGEVPIGGPLMGVGLNALTGGAGPQQPTIMEARNAANEAVFKPYVVPASNALAEAGGQGLVALQQSQAMGTPNGRTNPEQARAAGEAIGGNILPTTPEMAALQLLTVPKGASLLERLDPTGVASLVSPAARQVDKAVVNAVPIPQAGGAQEPLSSILSRADRADPRVTGAYLRSVAEDRGIDLAGATKKADILAALKGSVTEAAPAPAALPTPPTSFLQDVAREDLAGNRHTLTLPDGSRSEWRGYPNGDAHLLDTTVMAERQGNGTLLRENALQDIYTQNPNAVVTADFNSEGGIRLFNRGAEPGQARFFDQAGGREIGMDEAIARVQARQGAVGEMAPPSAARLEQLGVQAPAGGGVRPGVVNGEAVTPAPVTASTQPPPASGLPINDPEKFQAARLYTQSDPPNPPLVFNAADKATTTEAANEARTRLYNGGIESSGSSEQILARYNAATEQGIKLPYREPPSGMPDAFDLARRGQTPQSPLNAVPTPPEPVIRPELGQLQPPGSGAIRNSDLINSDTLSQASKDFLQSPNGQAAAAQRDGAIMANAAPEALRQEASRTAADLGIPDKQAQEILKNWEGNARLTQDTGNPKGIARLAASLERPVEGGATGNYTDSFLTGLGQRRTDLEQTLARGTDMSPQMIRETVDDALEGRLINHYGNDYAGLQQARQTLAKDEARAAELATDFRTLNTFVERTKNTMFPLDIGFFGQNVLTGMRQGGITTIAGMANRVALALHMPFAANLEAATGLPRILAASNDGLKLGNIASGIKPDEGTLLRYIPGISAIDKHAITPLLGKLTDAQYTGVGGFLKMMNYEGNLMVLGATGRDISNPAVRREAARITNNAWSSASLATTPGRRQAEKLAFTSPAFTRSQPAVLNDMAKLITPGASSTERILAGTAILSNVAFAAGVYKLLNDQLGVGPAQLNPLQPGFGTITLPTKNANGNNHVVNLFPQRTFQTFVTRAIDAIGNQDEKAMLSALARLGAGRAGALPAAGVRAFGYGYDTNGKFHLGGMDIEERVRASLPVPTSLQNVVTGGATDPLTMGLELAGVPNYESFPGAAAIYARADARNEASQRLYGEDYKGLGSREKEAANAQLNPEQLKAQRDEAVKAGNKVEIAQQQREDLKQSFQPHFAALEAKLKDGSMPPYQVRQLTSALEQQMYSAMDKVKFPEAGGDYKPSPIQKAESEYRSLYDKAPKGADGKVDYDALHRLQVGYVVQQGKAQGLDFANRLMANVSPRVNPGDSKIQQFYDTPQMKAAASGYNAQNNNPSADAIVAYKNAYKLEDPQRDAMLYAGGYTRTLASPAAAEAYKTYSEGKPEVNFNVGFRQEGYQTYKQMEAGPMAKEVKEYQAIPSLDRDDYLRAHPDLNAALWQHGHTSHIYSMDAYEKVTGKTPTGAVASVPTPPAAAGVQRSSVPIPAAAPPPQQSVAALGPDGRTVAQIAGTPYKSEAERNFYFESRGLQVPVPGKPANPAGSLPPSGGSGSAYQTNAQGRTPPVNAADMAPIAQRYGINPGPFALLMNHEGNGAHDTSEKGVQPARWGIVQTTAKNNGITDTRTMTPEQAYNIAGKYIATGLEQNKGDEAKAYGSYFVGQGNIQKAVAMGGDWVKNADQLAYEEGKRVGVNYGTHSMTDFMQYLGFR